MVEELHFFRKVKFFNASPMHRRCFAHNNNVLLLRARNVVFASLKKFPSDFFNPTTSNRTPACRRRSGRERGASRIPECSAVASLPFRRNVSSHSLCSLENAAIRGKGVTIRRNGKLFGPNMTRTRYERDPYMVRLTLCFFASPQCLFALACAPGKDIA